MISFFLRPSARYCLPWPVYCVCVCVRVCVYVCVHVVYMDVYMYVDVPVILLCPRASMLSMNTRALCLIHVFMYVPVTTSVYAYADVYIYAYVYAYVYGVCVCKWACLCGFAIVGSPAALHSCSRLALVQFRWPNPVAGFYSRLVLGQPCA